MLAWTGALAAAAAVMFVVFLGFARKQEAAASVAQRPSPVPSRGDEAEAPVRVAVSSDAEGVRVKSSNPGVTIFWLFPNPPRRGEQGSPAEGAPNLPSRSGS